MAMGGDVGGRNLEAPHPVGQHQGGGVVLGAAVAAVAGTLVFAVQRRFEAEMQGKVVDRAPHLRVGDHPVAVEG